MMAPRSLFTAKQYSIETSSPEETTRLGEEIGSELRAGDTVLLSGPLGAGKTILAKGICKALKSDFAKSPSFVYVNVYQGVVPIYHIDLYRMDMVIESLLGEVAEYLYDDDAVKIVEWGEKLPDEILPSSFVRISIEVKGENVRRIFVEYL